ncbi:MAG: CBS domain-containing protein [Eubacteriales bacterium]|nr:CBS domain-containing protein [Eubacteriales bacterium]
MSNMSNSTGKTLGVRFLDAYNAIDKALRVQYNFKTTTSFSDLIRRCADLNSVIRGHENDLINFARLRNAIVHSSDNNKVIAEPHLEVVQLMEKIATLITTPPLVADVLHKRPVTIIDANRSLYDLIKETGVTGHGMIPAYKGSHLIGIVRWRKLIEDLATILDTNDLDDFIRKTSIESYLRMYPQSGHFAIANKNLTIEQALTIFNNNRKIAAILITEKGSAMERPIGFITNADIIDLVKIIETY